MRVKKSLLLLVFVFVLVAAALMSPAVASGGPTPNQPVAWVNAYTNSNHLGFESIYPYHVTLSVHVKLLGNGQLVGHVVNRLYLPELGITETWVMHPVKSKWTHFTSTVAQFLVEIEGGDPAVLVLTDNGEPPTGDLLESFDPYTLEPGPSGPEAAGNVQIHLAR